MESPSCPSHERLKALLDGQLSANDQSELQQHIDSCERCQQTLEGLVAGKESWDGIAQRLGDGGTPVTPALHEAINAAKEIEATIPTVKLPPGFLQPAQQTDSMGRLAHYEVLREVGSGGMGIVLKAFDTSLRRVVAIKVMAPHLAANAAARRRFVREAQAAAAVAHEHVVAIHAVADQHEPPYLAMQFIEGKTLQERLDKSGPLSVREVLRIGMQTAAGLAAAHAQGLVHRDIKPANILLENGIERVKLTDFGLARAVDDASVTQSGVIAGTPLFMSPEQARGEAVDHRSDLFSLGSVMYAMCVGHAPFRASTTMGVIKRVCDESPRPIRDLNPDVPEWLVKIIDKLLAKNPADRIPSAQEVADLLGQCLAHLQQPQTISLPMELAPALEQPSSVAAPSPVLDQQSAFAVKALTLPAVGLLGLFVVSAAMGMMRWQEFVMVSCVLGLWVWFVRWIVSARHAQNGAAAQATAAPGGPARRSEGWRLRCTKCGTTRSLASMGWVRIGAASVGKRAVGWCSTCRAMCTAAVEWGEIDPNEAPVIDPRRSVARAAMGLIVTGLVNWLTIFVILAWLYTNKQPHEFESVAFPVFSILAIGSGVILFGAYRMVNCDSYRWAKTAAICSMLIGPGYVIGWPCGILALAVLARRDVREEFGAATPSASASDDASTNSRTRRKRIGFVLGFVAGSLSIAWLTGSSLQPIPGPAGAWWGFVGELSLWLAAGGTLVAGILVGGRRFVRGLDTTTPGGRLWGTAISGALLAILCAGLLLVGGFWAVYQSSYAPQPVAMAHLTFKLAGPQINVTLNGEKVTVPPGGQVDLSLVAGEYVIATIKNGRPEVRSGETLHAGEVKVVEYNESQAEAIQITGPLVMSYGPGANAPNVADYIKLQGRWAIVSEKQGGELVDAPQRGKWIEFDRGTMRWDTHTSRYPVFIESFVAIYSAIHPEQIDILNYRASGIYKLDGDSLTLAIADPDKPRPTEFASRPGSSVTLTVCRRAATSAKPIVSDANAVRAAEPDRNAMNEPLMKLLLDEAGAWNLIRSPDGKQFGAIGPNGGGGGSKVKVWETATLAERFTFTSEPTIHDLVFFPDGQRLATCESDHRIRLRDLITGRILSEFEPLPEPTLALSVSDDGTTLVSGVADMLVRVWDLTANQVRKVLTGATTPIHSVAVSPEGKFIAAGCENGHILIWDAKTAVRRHLWTHFDRKVTSLSFSPDSRHLAAASWNHLACVFDLGNDFPTKFLKAHTDHVRTIAWSPDGKRVATASSDGSAIVWDAAKADRLAVFNANVNQCFDAVFLDNERLATAHRDGHVRVWSASEKVPSP